MKGGGDKVGTALYSESSKHCKRWKWNKWNKTYFVNLSAGGDTWESRFAVLVSEPPLPVLDFSLADSSCHFFAPATCHLDCRPPCKAPDSPREAFRSAAQSVVVVASWYNPSKRNFRNQRSILLRILVVSMTMIDLRLTHPSMYDKKLSNSNKRWLEIEVHDWFSTGTVIFEKAGTKSCSKL